MNKFVASGILAGVGVVGTGIYFVIPSSSNEVSPNIQEEVEVVSLSLSKEEQDAYRGRYTQKLPNLNLLEYDNQEEWEKANTRSLSLIALPAGLGNTKDWKGVRDWCYSIADKSWAEDKNEHEHIPKTAESVCQVPKVPEEGEVDSRDDGEDFDNLESVGSQDPKRNK